MIFSNKAFWDWLWSGVILDGLFYILTHFISIALYVIGILGFIFLISFVMSLPDDEKDI